MDTDKYQGELVVIRTGDFDIPKEYWYRTFKCIGTSKGGLAKLLVQGVADKTIYTCGYRSLALVEEEEFKMKENKEEKKEVILEITYDEKKDSAQIGIYTETEAKHVALISAIVRIFEDHDFIYNGVMSTMESKNEKE
jgi:hypothetical protein